MSRGVNKVILVGRAGHAPVLWHLSDGAPVCNVSLTISDD